MSPGPATERDVTASSVLCPPAFTGRDHELAALTRALAVPAAVVLIEGEAGIGKSRLIRQCLASSEHVARTALVACCPPFRRPHTLGPVTEALRQMAGQVRCLQLSGLAGSLRTLFPEWAADLPPAPEPAEDATAGRHRLFRALAELIGRLGVTLVVAEDAHWADEATLEFLLFLVSRPAGSGALADTGPPVSLVVTYRPEDVPAGSLLPRLARLAAGASGLRLGLGALSAAGTSGLVSSMLAGERLSGEFAGFVHEHTGGVPLAVEESVRLMATRADLVRRDGRWVRREMAEMTVPPPVRDMVLERASRLGPDAQAVLRAVAVLGEPAAEGTVTAITGLSPERARAGLSQALAGGLLAEDRRGLVALRHALACQAVYETIPGPERRVLHQRAGQALESLSPPPVASLARHFREAGNTELWLNYAEQVADLALAAGDEATAALLLHDLITGAGLPSRSVIRLASKIVLLALPGENQLRDLAGALQAVLAAGGLTPAEEAGLRFQRGRLLGTMSEVDASRAELQRAVAGLPPGSLQAVRAMMLLGWPHGSTCPAAEHLRWLRRAAAADASVPAAERLRLLVDRVTALLTLGEEAGWAEADRIPWHPSTPGQRLQITRGHANIGEAAMVWGRYAEARRRLEHAVELASSYHYPRLRDVGLAHLAHLDWLTGAWPGLAGRAGALAADADIEALARLEAVLITGLLQAVGGAGEEAVQHLQRVVVETGRRGAVGYVMEPAAALARLYLAAGDVTQALKVTEEPAGVVVRKGTWIWAADLAPARSAALVAADRSDEAAELITAFGRGLRGRDAPAAKAALTLCRAILAGTRGEHARAAALFARAAEAWQALSRSYDALLARERQAGCLRAAGHPKAALDLLAEVLRGLYGLGAAADAGRVARTLREQGVRAARPRPGRPSYGGELSPRELAVVRLLAAGQTDAQIARALFVSPKTVASHVSSARRKLHATSRTALAMNAAAAGLLPGGPAGSRGA